MNKLIITVGLPRSGKSTWAKEQNIPIVSPDSIRLALHGERWNALAEPFVWAIAKVMVRALFISGHDTVILDSTAITKFRRNDWKSNEWVRLFKEFDTSKEICIERAKATNQEDLIPVISRMNKDRDPITDDELTKEELSLKEKIKDA